MNNYLSTTPFVATSLAALAAFARIVDVNAEQDEAPFIFYVSPCVENADDIDSEIADIEWKKLDIDADFDYAEESQLHMAKLYYNGTDLPQDMWSAERNDWVPMDLPNELSALMYDVPGATMYFNTATTEETDVYVSIFVIDPNGYHNPLDGM